MDKLSIQIIEQQKLGMLLFDEDLKITETSNRLKDILSAATGRISGRLITDVFPELIGLEPEIENIIRQKKAITYFGISESCARR